MKSVKHGIPAFLLVLLLAVLPASITVAQQGSETGSQADGQTPTEETGQAGEPPAEEPEQPAEPPTTEAPPEPAIEPPAEAAPAVSDIPRRAREAAEALRSLREKARPQPSVAEADRNLPALIEAVEALKKSTAASELETLSVPWRWPGEGSSSSRPSGRSYRPTVSGRSCRWS